VLAAVCSIRAVQRRRTHAQCAVASWQSVFCGFSRTKSSSTLVNSGALNQVGEVDQRTPSSVQNHDAQLELYTVVDREPVEVSEGWSDVIALSQILRLGGEQQRFVLAAEE